jgi:hypothetical protein
MRLNPRENEFKIQDDELINSLTELLQPVTGSGLTDGKDSWVVRVDTAVDQAREVLKREWEVAKQLPWLWKLFRTAAER